ncbi:MAG: aromatic ring-hydroxylating dioxygenase subunit alpha [Kangiellaceae bacterium]|jgi:choline monooxygenase|nr:aromatic ring-hydroxylating dioxygenase subunit alpha [Kangiellaceae bacterium]
MMTAIDKQQLEQLAQPIPLEQATTLPASVYTEQEFHQFDLATIFAKSWQCVGYIQQVENAGDIIVVDVADKPIIVVRNHDHQLKAFYNVCKHRAGPLAYENGNVKVLSCKYHGWSYQLDGQLRTAPEMESSPNFDKCQIHLDEIYVDTWQNLVFVSLTMPERSLEEIFKGIADNIQPIGLSQMEFHHRDEYVIDCNWKVYMDNYLEGYHLPHVHPGLNKLLDYKSYDTKLDDWYSYQFSPLENTDNFYGDGEAHYYCVYPNLMLNVLPGRCQVNIVLPISPNQCKVIFDYYYIDLNSEKTAQMIKQDLSFSDEVQDEDIAICQHVQKGLRSGSYDKGQLCVKRESGVWHFQELVRQAYRRHID